MDNLTFKMEQAALNLLTDEFYIVKEFETLREAVGAGLDDRKIARLLEWKAEKAA